MQLPCELLYLTILFIKNIIRILFNIIRYYLTGIIVKKMVLLLNRARRAPPPKRPGAARKCEMLSQL